MNQGAIHLRVRVSQWLKSTVYWKKAGDEDLGLILVRGQLLICLSWTWSQLKCLQGVQACSRWV